MVAPKMNLKRFEGKFREFEQTQAATMTYYFLWYSLLQFSIMLSVELTAHVKQDNNRAITGVLLGITLLGMFTFRYYSKHQTFRHFIPYILILTGIAAQWRSNPANSSDGHTFLSLTGQYHFTMAFSCIFIVRNVKTILFPLSLGLFATVTTFLSYHSQMLNRGDSRTVICETLLPICMIFTFTVTTTHLYGKAQREAYQKELESHLLLKDLRNMVQYAPIGYVVYDTQCQEIRFANERATEIMDEDSFTVSHLRSFQSVNTSVSEVSAHTGSTAYSGSLYSRIHEDDIIFDDLLSSNLKKSVQKGFQPLKSLGVFKTHLNKRTESRIIEKIVRVSKRETTWKTFGCVLLLLEDITDSEQAYYEVQEKMDLKVNWLRTVTHEFKTPLNTICGMTEFLLETTDLGPDMEQNFKIISQASQRLSLYVRDLLDYFQLQGRSLNVVPVFFNPLETVQKCLDLVAMNLKGRNLQATVQMASDIPDEIRSDPGRVEQILLNLLSNAIKFSHEGSRIELTLDTGRRKEDGNPQIIMSVRDHGIGIKQIDHPTIFQEFGKIKSKMNPQGVGLGLWISQKISVRLGGSLTFKSKFGKGSEFTLTIDQNLINQESVEHFDHTDRTLDDDSSLQILKQDFVDHETFLDRRITRYPSSSERIKGKTITSLNHPENSYLNSIHLDLAGCSCPKVLIVEDEIMNRMLLGKLLDKMGISYEMAEDGKKALEMIENRSRMDCCIVYDLIIVDYAMPEIDGPELAKIISRRVFENTLPAQILIGHTAYSASEDLNYFLDCGVRDILPKPLTLAKLQEIIDTYTGLYYTKISARFEEDHGHDQRV